MKTGIGYVIGVMVVLGGVSLRAQCNFEVNLTGKDVQCFGEANGEVTVSVKPTGTSTGPYEIQWFDGFAGSFRDDLPAGTHFVKVTDALGCFLNEFITLNEPKVLELQLQPTHVRCFGAPQGSIDLTAAGGTTPYFYQWSNGESTEDVDVLLAGDYTITVTDNHGCADTMNQAIHQPDLLKISSSVIPVSCFNGDDGEIKSVVFGGVQPYRYNWSTGDTIPNVFNLPAGIHSLTVTDANLCTTALDVNVPQPPAISAKFTAKKLTCFNLPDGEIFVLVSGGTPAYQYKWSNSDFVLGDTTNHPTDLVRDWYLLEVVDAKGCHFKDSVRVEEPNPLVINLEGTDATCFSKPDGSIDLSVSGGNLPYSILWSTGYRNEDVAGLLSGLYSVDVVDSLGCARYGELFVGQPDSLDFRVNVEEVSCKDEDDGRITIDPAGGTPAYQAGWSTGQSDFKLTDLPGDSYSVVLTDAQSCVYEGTFIVPVNPGDCITLIVVPNTFTPNNDGINDVWNIRHHEVYPSMMVRVFDKWGKRVLESRGYDVPWDGTHNGTAVQSGTYFYTINLNNGDPPFSGALTIIR